MRYKIGDSVQIDSTSMFYLDGNLSNPAGVTGVIYNIDENAKNGYIYKVKWDEEYGNDYREVDLFKVKPTKKKTITRTDIEDITIKLYDEGRIRAQMKKTPLTDNQISSSSKYIAALKLGAMVLGEIRAMHFDASFLDKNSLSEIQDWANENDLQLLIERPDFDGGEIKYEII